MKTSATDSGNNAAGGGQATDRLALWVLTSNGMNLGHKIRDRFQDSDIFVSDRLDIGHVNAPVYRFKRLSDALGRVFTHYRGHLFIMAAGIVVRVIAPLIRHKTRDPAVVVLDEKGRFAISLLSGHLGGANRLAVEIAAAIGATPVVTTATDINGLPSVDIMAERKGLYIQNPRAIKNVNMAILAGETISVFDPYGLFGDELPNTHWVSPDDGDPTRAFASGSAGVYVDDREVDLPSRSLILRPGSLAVGIGCNRGTPAVEIRDLLMQVLDKNRLSLHSLYCLASIDIKKDEPGLQSLSQQLELPLLFYPRDTLKRVDRIQSPSAMVEKHLGVKNVCEAAAILAARNGKLIVPKQTTRNVTVAIARISYTS